MKSLGQNVSFFRFLNVRNERGGPLRWYGVWQMLSKRIFPQRNCEVTNEIIKNEKASLPERPVARTTIT